MTEQDVERLGHGAVLYDIRDPENRPCCSRGGRCLHHVTEVYEETDSEEILYKVWDGTHTTKEWVNHGSVKYLYEPAGWSCPVWQKPTYVLTRYYGVEDNHDLMTDGGREQSGDRVCRHLGCDLPQEFPGGPSEYCIDHSLSLYHHWRLLAEFGPINPRWSA